jgi:hypothetical protein
MFNLEIGQELEFIQSVSVEDRTIPKGTQVRVGAILAEVVEPKVVLVVLGRTPVETLTVPRHILTLHSRPVQKKP